MADRHCADEVIDVDADASADADADGGDSEWLLLSLQFVFAEFSSQPLQTFRIREASGSI